MLRATPHQLPPPFLLLLLLLPRNAAAAAPTPTATLAVSTRSVASGGTVRVSWAELGRELGLDLTSLPDHRTEWRTAEPQHAGDHPEPECHVVGDGAGSLWLAQFSPAVTSLADLHFAGDPNLNVDHIATEGTPPFLSPAPVKFISGTQLSAGHFDFVVTNMRASVNWVLFKGDLNTRNITAETGALAVSPTVTVEHLEHPSQVRLARTTAVSEMRVSWTSTKGRAGHQAVQWGLTASSLDRTAPAPVTSTYTAADLCGSPANSSGFHNPGTFFTTILDLSAETVEARTAGQQYYYRVTDDTLEPPAGGWPVHSFRAPKPPNPHARMSIVVTADMGETYEDGSQYHWEEPSAVNTTLQMGLQHFPDVDIIMHPGDLACELSHNVCLDRHTVHLRVSPRRIPPYVHIHPHTAHMHSHANLRCHRIRVRVGPLHVPDRAFGYQRTLHDGPGCELSHSVCRSACSITVHLRVSPHPPISTPIHTPHMHSRDS